MEKLAQCNSIPKGFCRIKKIFLVFKSFEWQLQLPTSKSKTVQVAQNLKFHPLQRKRTQMIESIIILYFYIRNLFNFYMVRSPVTSFHFVWGILICIPPKGMSPYCNIVPRNQIHLWYSHFLHYKFKIVNVWLYKNNDKDIQVIEYINCGR